MILNMAPNYSNLLMYNLLVGKVANYKFAVLSYYLDRLYHQTTDMF